MITIVNGKTLLIVAVVIALAAAGWYFLAYKQPGTTTPGTNTNSQSTTNSSTTPTSTNAVSIQSMAFSPSSITVKKGTTVTWNNNDSVPHTVTESDGQTGPGSQTLNPGQTYSFTFNGTGTFPYHCTIHSFMTGTVTVTN